MTYAVRTSETAAALAASQNKVSRREAKLIHALLKGRTADKDTEE